MTLATIADALIEFILSLLRDPAAAAEFQDDPEGTLAHRGLGNASAADVCAVAPIIAERPEVAAIAIPRPAPPDARPVVREITEITRNFTMVDDRDTVVDQSVNQNIWAMGDVTQVFDQEAVVASGDESMAAGDDATVDNDIDQSTTIGAGDDVVIDGEVTENTATDSYNETTDTTTTTDAPVTIAVTDSANQTTTPETTPETVPEPAADAYEDSAAGYTEAPVDNDATSVFDSSETPVLADTADDDF
ncbi:IniB N-terminal domain-containing protein [Microbacterium sp. RD1]|uniref:IniB N-terminal domain-containing protein n=1 Tax=Microbacterium sp. RD1 TaxID=3457313 RepID=UPI003FA52357